MAPASSPLTGHAGAKQRRAPQSGVSAADNRLTSEECRVLAAAKQYFGYRTPQNRNHLIRATKDYIRADSRRR